MFLMPYCIKSHEMQFMTFITVLFSEEFVLPKGHFYSHVTSYLLPVPIS